MRESNVILTTLSGAGHRSISSLAVEVSLEHVIIDEAAQSTEPGELIPLQYGCRKCVMIGDPKQLPPTVFPKLRHKIIQFVIYKAVYKLREKAQPLNVQYRMHPSISRFPSQNFYENELKDGSDVCQTTTRPWNEFPKFDHFRFYHVKGYEKTSEKQSPCTILRRWTPFLIYTYICWTNFQEAHFAIRLGLFLHTRNKFSNSKQVSCPLWSKHIG